MPRHAKPVNKKESITNELLSKMFHSLHKPGNIKNKRTICACQLGYRDFLISEELFKLKRTDVLIKNTYMSVFIQSSKTDKYREGASILIARTGIVLCPVLNLERYFFWANVSDDSAVYIFFHFSAAKTGHILEKKAGTHTVCLIVM